MKTFGAWIVMLAVVIAATFDVQPAKVVCLVFAGLSACFFIAVFVLMLRGDTYITVPLGADYEEVRKAVFQIEFERSLDNSSYRPSEAFQRYFAATRR